MKGNNTMVKRLLIVDDEEEICDFLRSFFEDRKFLVETAHSGVQALEKVRTFGPHIVLLDIQMPEMDGMKALKIIKQENPLIKVIMVTAVETQEKIEESMRLGADNYITKPLSLEYLENDVQEKLNSLVR